MNFYAVGRTGVTSFEISLEKKEVIVKGTAPIEVVLEKISKTGKKVRKKKHVHTQPPFCIPILYSQSLPPLPA
jgi:hypothetical protein